MDSQLQYVASAKLSISYASLDWTPWCKFESAFNKLFHRWMESNQELLICDNYYTSTIAFLSLIRITLLSKEEYKNLKWQSNWRKTNFNNHLCLALLSWEKKQSPDMNLLIQDIYFMCRNTYFHHLINLLWKKTSSFPSFLFRLMIASLI